MALKRPQIEILPGKNDPSEWYWHLQDRNGKLVASSGEGFVSKSNAKRAAKNARKTFALAKVTG